MGGSLNRCKNRCRDHDDNEEQARVKDSFFRELWSDDQEKCVVYVLSDNLLP